LKISTEQIGKALVIQLDGGLGYENFKEFGHEVRELTMECGDRVVFDMKRLTYLSSWGVGAFVSAAGRIRRRGGMVKVVNLNPEIASAFRLMRLTHIFDLCDGMDEAIAQMETESGGG